VQYWEVVTRSFRISWNHKYLWLIALFAGEGGGGGYNFNFSPPSSTGRPGTSVGGSEQVNGSADYAAFQHQVTTWLSDHIGLIVALLIVWLLFVVAFFILAAVCEGATVRASAEHDAERPFGLRMAWRVGVATMWVIVRFRLLIIALGLPVTIVVIALGVGIVLSFVNKNFGAGFGLIGLAVLIVILAIPYAIYLFFLDRLGSRAVVLEQLGARAAIVRAHRLLRKRLGRTLLVGLIGLAIGIAIGIALACIFAVISLPFALIGVIAYSTNSAAGVAILVLAVLILLPISLVVGGYFSAQGSTYWTLAFRRLDLDAPPPPQITS
jgi:hypothetical protein